MEKAHYIVSDRCGQNVFMDCHSLHFAQLVFHTIVS